MSKVIVSPKETKRITKGEGMHYMKEAGSKVTAPTKETKCVIKCMHSLTKKMPLINHTSYISGKKCNQPTSKCQL